MNNRTTPEHITSLKENEIFVFGSNTGGKHGAGAAKTALKWGAKWGKGSGAVGQTYGIPTKNHNITRTLRIDEIIPYVEDFIEHAIQNPDQVFLVTEIGCGLAGYDPKDIAPLFKGAITVENIHLPERFWRKILK